MATAPADIVHDRHIILVGKTGCGKSTVANNILRGKIFKVQSDVESTKGKSKHTTTSFKHEEIWYKLMVIDSVGLFDTSPRDNELIIDDIKDCIKLNAPNGFNLVLFVIKQGRFTSEESEMFDFLISNLKGKIEDVSALIITHCENKSEKAREDYIETFYKSEATKKYAKMMKRGIYTVGFPQLSELDEEDVPRIKEKMKMDEKKLRDLVVKSTTKFLKEEIENEVIVVRTKKFCMIL